ncbi:MAG: hypothetical protein KME26_01715 [Oscillatoria princeps RMCB-10]|nr:hypothetical protein [Oscillatoria princeps RMCB-10]
MLPNRLVAYCLSSQTLFLLALILPGSATGCSFAAPVRTQYQSQEVKMKESQSLVTLTGTILFKDLEGRMPTPEAWMAGESKYYVLDVGDAQIEQPTAEEGVILRTSDQISTEIFQQYIGKRVIIEGEYVAPKPFIPQSPMVAYPMGPDRQPLPTGGGFKVYRLEAIGEK